MDENKKVTPFQKIILDTNILHYLTDKKTESACIKYIIEIQNRGFLLSISEITHYETIRGATKDIEKSRGELLSIFYRYFVTLEVLIVAGQLDTLYKMYDFEPKQIEICDKIIGATSILTGSPIITANSKDFPYPYFFEAERKILEFEISKNRTRCIVLCVLKPDLDVISKKFSERP